MTKVLFKWILPSILVIVFVLGVVYYALIQNITTNTSSEIEVLADTLSLGVIRSELNEEGQFENKHIDKDEVIANIVSKIIKVQTNHPYNIKVDYVFFDKDKNATSNDEDIRSLQFRIQYVNDNGEVVSTSERHLTLDQLN